MRTDLPSGTVTFLFTDVEGSTRLLDELGAEGYAAALAEHRRVIREGFAAHGGVEVDTQGDAFFVAFPTAPGALAAADEMLRGLAAGPIRVRMGIHTGTPLVAEEGYVGVDVNRAARIAAVGHGGQVLVSAATAALSGADGLRDLGEHRLKDLSAPERIYQLGEAEYPPLTSLHRTNLPIPATPFLGRAHELGEVLELLERDDVRLLTLTGPGGTGKTRLALHAAGESAERFPHGVFWVPLAPLRDPALVLETAAAALGASDGLSEHVADKTMLLLLDNFEHVVAAAAGLSELLAACPNLQLVVTSRELLRLPGEQAYPVPTLEPDDGTELFVARARAVQPRFEAGAAVRELCARLDNLPLAIELAATRVRVLPAEQLLERLAGRLDLLKGGRGADPRQQTLRATIEWSHELLDAEERRLFASLAVFAGGCTLEGAEEICDADLDTLESLVDKSLVRVRDDGRIWMLETIREFAIERLGEADELRDRHAEWFLALAEDAEPQLVAGAQAWFDRLEQEHDNIRAALDRLELTGDTDSALRLAVSVVLFWERQGHWKEARRRLAALIYRDEGSSVLRAKALAAAASLEASGGDAETGRRLAEQALALGREAGDVDATARALFSLAYAVAEQGEFARAQEAIAESIRLFGEVGDEHSVIWATRTLAWTSAALGQLERARGLHEENLQRARALGNAEAEATLLGGLAMLAVDDRLEDAVSMLKENTRILRTLDDAPSTTVNLVRLAVVLVRLGRPSPAASLLAASERSFEELGGKVPWVVRMSEETLAEIRAELDEAALAEAWAYGGGLTADEAVDLALESLGP